MGELIDIFQFLKQIAEVHISLWLILFNFWNILPSWIYCSDCFIQFLKHTARLHIYFWLILFNFWNILPGCIYISDWFYSIFETYCPAAYIALIDFIQFLKHTAQLHISLWLILFNFGNILAVMHITLWLILFNFWNILPSCIYRSDWFYSILKTYCWAAYITLIDFVQFSKHSDKLHVEQSAQLSTKSKQLPWILLVPNMWMPLTELGSSLQDVFHFHSENFYHTWHSSVQSDVNFHELFQIRMNGDIEKISLRYILKKLEAPILKYVCHNFLSGFLRNEWCSSLW